MSTKKFNNLLSQLLMYTLLHGVEKLYQHFLHLEYSNVQKTQRVIQHQINTVSFPRPFKF